MEIIVVGCGKVGYSIAKQLSEENHTVTVVDKKAAALKYAEESLRVLTRLGSGASIETLLSSGVRSAELVIAVTGEDELNIVCCLMAKKLGVAHTVARIRNPEYSKEAALLQEQIGLERIINPELSAAREISRLIRFPDAVHADAFAQGKAEMIGFKVLPEDGLSDIPISALSGKLPKNVLICAIDRGGELIVPRGSDRLFDGDVAYIMAQRTDTSKFFKTIGRKQMRARDVMIIGGGRISVYLARRLDSVGIRVVIIEINEEKCHMLSELLPFATIIHGDGTDAETMNNENVSGMDYFIAATNRDEENIFAALNAKKSGAKRVIVKINRDALSDMLRELGVERSFTPKETTAAQIIRYVRGLANSKGSEILTLYKIIGGQAEAMEFLADSRTKFAGIPLKKIRIKRGMLLCAIIRGSELIIPGGEDYVKAGDHVIVIANASHALNDINDITE